jgi:hypothetical protein
MKGIPKFWIAAVAIVAAVGVLVVLITPAPDELPTTGPHAVHKIFFPVSEPLNLPSSEMSAHVQISSRALASRAGGDLLALTCSRLC